MFKTAMLAMQNLPPLAFFREADGLRDEALSSVAEFLHSVASPGSSASREERCLAMQLLLELAVARGSLRCSVSPFVLSSYALISSRYRQHCLSQRAEDSLISS
jgi:hypothetical protein